VLDRDGKFPDRYPYPVQVWQFGNSLKLIALGGEVVVDYSLRLKSRHGFDDTGWRDTRTTSWGTSRPGACWRKGGYEGGDAMIYFGQAGRFGGQVEEIIAGKVSELVARTSK